MALDEEEDVRARFLEVGFMVAATERRVGVGSGLMVVVGSHLEGNEDGEGGVLKYGEVTWRGFCCGVGKELRNVFVALHVRNGLFKFIMVE